MGRKTFGAAATLGAFGASLALAVPASAQIEFATFRPVPSATGGVVNFMDDGSGDVKSELASTPTVFAFDLTPLANFGDLQSTFKFMASQVGAATVSSGMIAATFDGSFAFYYSGPTVTNSGVTLTNGELLLGGTFSDASFSGKAGASGGGLQDDSLTGTVAFTSGISAADLPLASSGQSFSLAFLDISPILGVQSDGDLGGFLARGGGLFSSELTTTGGGGGVPEPAGWALMLVGIGGVGVAMRRRARSVTA
jgi:hypothetical protein